MPIAPLHNLDLESLKSCDPWENQILGPADATMHAHGALYEVMSRPFITVRAAAYHHLTPSLIEFHQHASVVC